jgi:TP901 family phage tail tape measure protein
MAIFIPLVTRFDPKGLDGAQRALAQFSNFATQVARVAAAAIAGIAVLSTREAMQFETSLSKIQGLVGLTSAEVDDLAAAARRIAPAFGASATEAADALFFITSAGLRGAAATNVLEASLKGAAIGLGDAKTIADLATSAVNAYGESNLDGAKAVDILAEAVRLGKLEPAELAGAMGQVLPLASNLGVSFAEVGAAMAGMSKTGTDASTAATQLRQILATLAKPTAMRLTGALLTWVSLLRG